MLISLVRREVRLISARASCRCRFQHSGKWTLKLGNFRVKMQTFGKVVEKAQSAVDTR